MREECTIPSPDNCANYKVTVRVEKPKILAEAKRKVDELFRRKSSENLRRCLSWDSRVRCSNSWKTSSKTSLGKLCCTKSQRVSCPGHREPAQIP